MRLRLIRVTAVLDSPDVVRVADHAFGVKEPGGERAIVARRAHDDGERLPLQTHVKRLFYRGHVLGTGLGGAADPHDRHLAQGSQRERCAVHWIVSLIFSDHVQSVVTSAADSFAPRWINRYCQSGMRPFFASVHTPPSSLS